MTEGDEVAGFGGIDGFDGIGGLGPPGFVGIDGLAADFGETPVLDEKVAVGRKDD